MNFFVVGDEMEQKQRLEEELRAVNDRYRFKRRQIQEQQIDFQVYLIPCCIFMQNAKWRFCLMRWPPRLTFVVVHHKVSWRISYEWFDLESPNFTQTSEPVWSTTTPDMTSQTCSTWKLSRKTVENASFNGFKWGSQNFTLLSGTISLTNFRMWRHLLLLVGCKMQSKYWTKVRKTCVASKESINSATVQCKITKFYTGIHIHANLAYSNSGYDVTSCFRSAVIKV